MRAARGAQHRGHARVHGRPGEGDGSVQVGALVVHLKADRPSVENAALGIDLGRGHPCTLESLLAEQGLGASQR